VIVFLFLSFLNWLLVFLEHITIIFCSQTPGVQSIYSWCEFRELLNVGGITIVGLLLFIRCVHVMGLYIKLLLYMPGQVLRAPGG
jgi:hypothetical protein